MLTWLKRKYITSGLAAFLGPTEPSIPSEHARDHIDALFDTEVLKLGDIRRIQRLAEAAGLKLSAHQTWRLLEQVPCDIPSSSGHDRRSRWKDVWNTYSPFGLDWQEGRRHFRARAMRVSLDHGPGDPEIPEAVMRRLCGLRGQLPSGGSHVNKKLVQDLWCDAVMHEAADERTWAPFIEELFSEHPDYKRGSGDYSGRRAFARGDPRPGQPHHKYLMRAWSELYHRPEFLLDEQTWDQLEKVATEAEHAELIKTMVGYNSYEIFGKPEIRDRAIQLLAQMDPHTALDVLEQDTRHRAWTDSDVIAPLLAHTSAEIRQRAMRLSAKLEEASRPSRPQEATGSPTTPEEPAQKNSERSSHTPRR